MGLARTPTQILAANMEYFQGKADEFLAPLQAELLKGAPLEKLQHLLEEACKFKLRANTTAQMLAPYMHPKMQASPQKGEEVQPYVIRAPDMLQSPEAWMHAIRSPASPAPISQVKTIIANGSDRNG